MSDLRRNENCDNGPAEKPQLCHMCYEFFGSQSTEWLCFQCYK